MIFSKQTIIQSLILLVLIAFLSGCKEQIIHNLSETEINRIITKLQDKNIFAEKIKQSDGKWALAVESDQSGSALKYIDDTRLLRELDNEAPAEASIVSSREDQRFRFERSLSKQIELTLSTIGGVLESRVHLNLPPVDPLFGKPLDNSKGTASVLILSKPTFEITSDEIAALVSGASGIEKQKVTVLISRNNAFSEPLLTNKEEVRKNEVSDDSPKSTGVIRIIRTQEAFVEIGLTMVTVGICCIYSALRSRRKSKLVSQLTAKLQTVDG